MMPSSRNETYKRSSADEDYDSPVASNLETNANRQAEDFGPTKEQTSSWTSTINMEKTNQHRERGTTLNSIKDPCLDLSVDDCGNQLTPSSSSDSIPVQLLAQNIRGNVLDSTVLNAPASETSISETTAEKILREANLITTSLSDLNFTRQDELERMMMKRRNSQDSCQEVQEKTSLKTPRSLLHKIRPSSGLLEGDSSINDKGSRLSYRGKSFNRFFQRRAANNDDCHYRKFNGVEQDEDCSAECDGDDNADNHQDDDGYYKDRYVHDILAEASLSTDEKKRESLLLYYIFEKFSSPSPTFCFVSLILELEQCRVNGERNFRHLEQSNFEDVVINIGDSCIDGKANDKKISKSLVTQILESKVLLKLPVHFCLAFLRILIRLLTGESDKDYDDATFCALSMEDSLKAKGGGDGDGDGDQSKNKETTVHQQIRHGSGSGHLRTSSTNWIIYNHGLRHLRERNKKHLQLSLNSLYSAVRFRCGEKNGERVDVVLEMIESLLETSSNGRGNHNFLALGPLCRLLGILTSAGISPKQLRRILNLLSNGSTRMDAKAHILRALIVATEGSSAATKLRGKASPQSFFCVGRSSRFVQTLYPGKDRNRVHSWPFMASFGMACWFRIEGFTPSFSDGVENKQTLFKICSGDGTSFEISFKRLESVPKGANCVAHIIYSVRDSERSRKEAQTQLSRCIEIKDFPIVPHVWFHIAVRHTRKSYITIPKDEVTFFLDGKPMLTEQIRFPVSSSFMGDKNTARYQYAQPIEISFLSGIDAEAGALYVFDDSVSDDTLHALYEVTSGNTEINLKEGSPIGTLSPIDKKLNAKKVNPIIDEGETMVNMKKADVDELVIPHDHRDSSTGIYSKNYSSFMTALDLVGDGDYQQSSQNPAKGQFSTQAFTTSIFFVWDPTRVFDGQCILEAHSGAHCILDENNCVPWKMRGAKSVISCVGGVQSLLPALKSMICPEYFPQDSSQRDDAIDSQISAIFPLSFSLLAAFLRNEHLNGREWLRCGGTEILEYCLIKSKKVFNDLYFSNQFWRRLYTFRFHRCVAEDLIGALIDLKEACAYHSSLESKLYSTLLLNVGLWLGDVNQTPGIILHEVLLPTLSCLVLASPKVAAKLVNTMSMVNLIRDYSEFSSESVLPGHLDSFVHIETLTIAQRSHFIDIVMGIVFVVFSEEVNISNILPFVQFISHNLDRDWEMTHKEKRDMYKNDSMQKREQKNIATEKCCSLLMLLLQTRPVVIGLFESMNHILGDSVSWILCCMVNSYDDAIRSIGIRCFTAFYDAALSGRNEFGENSSVPMLGAKLAVSKVSRTIKSMGEGLGVLSKGFGVSTRSVDVGHKLLWHILKCHRYDLGTYSHNALLELLFYDPSNTTVTGNMVDQVITLNQAYQNGYRLNFDFIHKNESPFHSPKLKVRSRHATNCILQLLRFLPCLHQERLLFDLLTLVRVNKATVDDIIQARYWQHSLFHVASDTVEALINFNNVRSELLDSPNHSSDDSVSYDHKGNNVYARFDLSFQLYATLLGHCLRADDESAHALDLACSLQRVCVNGVSVFGILLSHVLNDLISNGTLISTLKTQSENSSCTESDILQDCATSFFKMDVTQAAKHWKKLRNLTALVTAVVTDNGHGLVDLFDYRNSLASIIDNNSGGIFGIRLSDRIQNGIMAIDVFAETTTARERCHSEEICQRMSTHYYRMICTTLSCQILDLLDPFIFFHSTGVLSSSPQQQGFALVQSIEPRLGLSQGPLIFSLVRLSLVALSHLEPSSSKFLRSCNMLRCFLRWCLDMVQNSSPTATKAFDEDTALNDRVIVCIILQCHRSLSKCFSVLNEIELLEGNHIQVSERPRHLRRLYSAVSVLGGIICDVYEARKNLLLEVLTKEAYSALESSVLMSDEWKNYAETTQPIRNRILRDFLESDWVKCFHDNDYFQANVDGIVSIVIPEILNRNGENKIDRAVYIMKELAVECKHIRDDYHHAIDSPFSKYLEDQKSWADTAAVRDLEYDGNCAINSLTTQYQCRLKTMARSLQIKCDISSRRYLSVQRKIQTNSKYIHWKLARSTDRLHRRILLIPNMNFDNHADASYDRASGLEMDAVFSETNLRREDQLQIVLKAAKEGIVRHHEAEKSDGYALNPDGDLCHDSEPENSSADFVFEENNPEWDHHVDNKLIVDKDINIGSSLWAKQYIWEPNERLLQYLKGVQVVTVQTVLNGELVLTTHSLYFRPIEEPKSVMTKESLRCPDRLEEGRWRLNRLTDVHERRYILRPQAIELFFVNAPELFINFSEGPKIRDKFVDNLRRCRTPLVTIPKALNPKAVFKRNFPLLTQRWQERKISNFEYLMKLNIIAGRTFNDISQYPVFPWIIADYESPELDLTNDKTFRDLTKPIGAINPQRLLQLLQRYHDLDGLPDEERFLYGSHYSSPGVVLHFLLRQEPFTSMAVELQSGRFDCPDRLFFDMAGCWHSCMHSTSDVKELIPEMFTCPEIFLNTNNFQFGKTQKDFPVDNVKLPPWANDSPYEFVRLNKLALESEYVSNHLHHWIDLIFGYKQRGPESIKANNVFHFLSYEGSVDLDKITDDLNRKATEAHIQNFGQTPSQLLATPHPARYAAVNCWKPVVSEYELNRLMSYTPFRQFGGSRNKNGHGPALSIEVFLDLVIVIYADLCVGCYKWAPTKHGKTPFLLKMDKIRSLPSRDMSVSKFAMEAHTGSINPSLPCSYESIGNWSFAVVKDKESFSPVSKDMTMTTQKFDATLLSCGYCDNSLKAHSIDGLRLKCSKTGGHIGAITCLELGEECSLLITGGEDATCRVWTVEQAEIGNALIDSYVKTAQDQKINDTLMCCLVLWGHNSAISCLAFDSDLDILISGSVDGYICIHTVRCGEFIRSLHTNDYQYPDTLPTKSKVETTGVRKLSLHKDGIFIAHLETGMLQMRSVNGAQLGCADAGEKLNVMKMIPGGYSLVTGGESGKVHVRSLQNLTIKYALNISDYGPVHSIAFNQPSTSIAIEQFIFVGSQDGSITVVCAQREKEVQDNDDASKAKFNQNQMIELGGNTSLS